MNQNVLHDFRLSFTTHNNNIMSITIPRANHSRTEAQILGAMDAIISTGIVHSPRGMPIARESAERVVTTRTDISVTA